MKVALVSPYPPSKGTLNEYAYYLVKHFIQKEEVEELVIITDKLEDATAYEKVDLGPKVKFDAVWSFNSLRTLRDIHKSLKRHNPDVVLYNIQFLSFGDKKIPATLGLLSPWISKISGIPSVALLHNIIETVNYSSAGITTNPIMKWAFNTIGTVITKIILSASLVTVTMPKYVKILTEKYKTSNVALVPHGSFELPPLPDFEDQNKPKKVMTFGKFGTYKKVEEMIEAVEIVRKRTGEEIEIVIAGTDNPNVKGYLEGVKKNYDYVPNIRFTGYVAEEEVQGLFEESTTVVFNYTSTTGSSGVLHQAGSYGKSVVLPLLGDLKDLIEEEGYKGLYFEPGNVNQLADAIEELVINDEVRQSIARQNYKAAASLPMSEITSMYTNHFHSLIRANSSFEWSI